MRFPSRRTKLEPARKPREGKAWQPETSRSESSDPAATASSRWETSSPRSRRRKGSTSSRPRPTGRRSGAESPPARCAWPPTKSSRRGRASTCSSSSAGANSRVFAGRSRSAPDALVLCEESEERPSGEDLGLVSGEDLAWVPAPLARHRPRVLRDSGFEERRHARHPRRAARAAGGHPEARHVPPLRAQEGIRARRQHAGVRGRPRIRGIPGVDVREKTPRLHALDPAAPPVRKRGRRASARSMPAAGSSRATPSRPRRRSCTSSTEWMPSAGGAFLQTEDELAAIGAVIGASFSGRQVDDGDFRPGPFAHDRDAGPGGDGGSSRRHRRRAARRPVDRQPDEERAVRPPPVPLRDPRRRSPGRARLLGRRGLLPRDGRGVQHLRGVPDCRSSSSPTRPSASARKRSPRGPSGTRCATARSRPQRSSRTTSATARRRTAFLR